MPKIVGVQFQQAGKLEYYAPQELTIKEDDWVIVESKRGLELGLVKCPPCHVADGDVTLPLKKSYVRLHLRILKYINKMHKMLKQH